MTFKLLEQFGTALLVSQARPGRRQFGVPPRGPFDSWSAQLSNALLGNLSDVGTLELCLASLKIEILDGGVLAWVGAGAWNGVRSCRPGEILSFASPAVGARSYIAGVGGLVTCGLDAFGSGQPELRPLRQLAQDPVRVGPIRICRGTHSELLSWDRFIASEFQVSNDSNRMGVRLESSSPVAHEISLKSEPTDVGAVQLPPSGNPIILGPDGPTIGGYPRVAWVVEEDLPMVAQLAPGQPVTFLEASMNAVCDKRAERDRLLKMVRYQALS